MRRQPCTRPTAPTTTITNPTQKHPHTAVRGAVGGRYACAACEAQRETTHPLPTPTAPVHAVPALPPDPVWVRCTCQCIHCGWARIRDTGGQAIVPAARNRNGTARDTRSSPPLGIPAPVGQGFHTTVRCHADGRRAGRRQGAGGRGRLCACLALIFSARPPRHPSPAPVRTPVHRHVSVVWRVIWGSASGGAAAEPHRDGGRGSPCIPPRMAAAVGQTERFRGSHSVGTVVVCVPPVEAAPWKQGMVRGRRMREGGGFGIPVRVGVAAGTGGWKGPGPPQRPNVRCSDQEPEGPDF